MGCEVDPRPIERGGCDWSHVTITYGKVKDESFNRTYSRCSPLFHGKELVEDSGGINGIRSLKIFSKSSAINGFGLPLSTIILVELAIIFPSAWWFVEDLYWAWKPIFSSTLVHRRVQIQNESNGIGSLRIFSKSSAGNGFALPLPTTYLVGKSCYSPQHDEYRGFYFGLKTNSFLWPYSPKDSDRAIWSEYFCIPLVTSKISLGIKELRINFVGNFSSKSNSWWSVT